MLLEKASSNRESTLLGPFPPKTGYNIQAWMDLNRNQRKNASSRFSIRKYVRAVLPKHTHTFELERDARPRHCLHQSRDGRVEEDEREKVGLRRKRIRESGVPHRDDIFHLPCHLQVRVFPALFSSPLLL